MLSRRLNPKHSQKPQDPPVTFEEIHQKELGAIGQRRLKWLGESSREAPGPPTAAAAADLKSVGDDTLGICFSGGGIRSATFNLGVLQGLAKTGILPFADYLSTVSGGGYIGAWFHALCQRKAWSKAGLAGPEGPYNSVEEFLDKETNHPKPADKDPITFLRQYSNYLAPKLGLLSADPWVIFSIWVRNTLLNQIVFVLALGAALMVPLLLGNFASVALTNIHGDYTDWMLGAALPIFLSLSWAVWRISWNLRSIVRREPEVPKPAATAAKDPVLPAGRKAWTARIADAVLPTSGDTDASIWLALTAPVIIAALILSFVCAANRFHPWAPEFVKWIIGALMGREEWSIAAARSHGFGRGFLGAIMWVALFVLFLVSLLGGGFFTQRKARYQGLQVLMGFLIVVVCATATWGLVFAAGSLLPVGGPAGLAVWHCIAWGPPLFVVALSLGVVLEIGLMGVDFLDSAREWYARLGANLLIAAAAWALLFALSAFAPLLTIWFFQTWTKTGFGAVATWLAATFGGIQAAKSSATAGTPAPSAAKPVGQSSMLELVARAAPPLAIAGFLIGVSTLTFVVIEKKWHRHGDMVTAGATVDTATAPSVSVSTQGPGSVAVNWTSANPSTSSLDTLIADSHDYSALHLGGAHGMEVLASWLVLLALAYWLSARFNINEFSMNYFYRNRLVRCYLGASHGAEGRQPNRFTGFDPQDDILLRNLVPGEEYDAPYAIVNCALNLNHGKELAWQERKASSFIFTPLYCGYKPASVQDQTGYVRTEGFTSPTGPHIGLATAISGAAASPNWGYHTSPVTAFLLALFNVRLGWWIGNTRLPKYPAMFGPRVALKYLFYEMFGLTTESTKFVNLSDGGHFENLGMYELVRRKCRFIIVGDGEQDENYVFESLGGAIRKARIDFGAEISLSPRRIFLKDSVSSVHCAVGDITYADGSAGKLFYIKASLTSDEPYDVEQYKKGHDAFPHEPTLNQFFTESQFESYRALGRHAVEIAFGRIAAPTGHKYLAESFRSLNEKWVTPTTAEAGVFTKHALAYTDLLQQLNKDPELRFLDSELLPNFPRMEARPSPYSIQMRKAKLLLTSFIQLMEDVYVDLNLEDDSQFAHPQYQGWIVLFTLWATPGTALDTLMEEIGTIYGRNFIDFYRRLRARHVKKAEPLL